MHELNPPIAMVEEVLIFITIMIDISGGMQVTSSSRVRAQLDNKSGSSCYHQLLGNCTGGQSMNNTATGYCRMIHPCPAKNYNDCYIKILCYHYNIRYSHNGKLGPS